MIHYSRRGHHFIYVMLRLRGSVIPKTVPIAMVSALIAFFLLNFQAPLSRLVTNPTVFTFWLQVASLILAFHTNSAYQRFWEGRSNLQSMASYWGDAISHLIAFDELTMLTKGKSTDMGRTTSAQQRPADLFEKKSSNGKELVRVTSTVGEWKNVLVDAAALQDCVRFRAQILHLYSLLHAVCVQYLLNKDGRGARLEILGGINQKEAIELERASDQAFLVSHRINQLIARRHILDQGLPIGGPVLSRTWQLNYLAMISYNQSTKIDDTPFPFPYIQLIYWLDCSVALISPFVIAVYVPSLPMAMILSFLTTFCYHSLFLASYFMETPFGRRSNDLPLLELHIDFINRLKILVDKPTAEILRDMTSESTAPSEAMDILNFTKSWPEIIPQTPLITDPNIPTSLTSVVGGEQQVKLVTGPIQEAEEKFKTERLQPEQSLHAIVESLPDHPSLSGIDNLQRLQTYSPMILSTDAGLPISKARRIGAPLESGNSITFQRRNKESKTLLTLPSAAQDVVRRLLSHSNYIAPSDVILEASNESECELPSRNI